MSQKRVNINTNIIIIIYFIMLIPSNLFGYIDPASIAVMLQVIIAAVVGVLAVFRNYIASVFKKLFKKVKGE